ncbi:hypothetical protein [Syntrophomonas palmitatica]|uniref:hypothetical protein n=1 Tax=Syntrophomonas palmitatica TaxID=402877 RepID=UPI0006D09644|nr:hypothetical protein [Syntrophomonas palmitatica]
MKLKLVSSVGFNPGDLVTVKNMPREEHFCIIAIKKGENGEPMALLKALFNDTYIIEKPVADLVSLLVKGRL